MPRKNSDEAGFTHIFVILALALVLTLVVGSNYQVSKKYPQNYTGVQGVYIAEGGDSSSGGSSGSSSGSDSSHDSGSSTSSSGSSSSSSSSGGSSSEGTSGDSGKSTSSNITAPLPPNSFAVPPIQINKDASEQLNHEFEQENEAAIGKDIDNFFSKDIFDLKNLPPQKGKVKFTPQNGIIKVKTENELGEDLSDNELNDFEQELSDDNLKIASAGAEIALVDNKNTALINLPVEFDLASKQLTVNTASGSKHITVTPDQAINNALSDHLLDSLESEINTLSPDLATKSANTIRLSLQDNQLVYEINGFKTNRLFGFIPINTQTKALISAENGKVLQTQESFLSNLLKKLSF